MPSTTTEYRARLKKIFDFLGGKCVECGTTEGLQVDHVDPAAKSFTVTKNWARSWAVLLEELKKCQLLCVTHHKAKTAQEESWQSRTNTPQGVKHGTQHSYTKYKCRCELCVTAKRASYRSMA